nr:RNA-directed DNA polymerase, eukaryota, reverse transcriptase zinc-binding domain protein [Tanacetum cinerariifolium]
MVGNTSTIHDSNGWYWKFKVNKKDVSTLIQNPFQKEVEKIAYSFFVTNFPDYVDAKRLWKECEPYGSIIDAFIANKRSKVRKQFGFVRFFGVKNDEQLAWSLVSIWIGSYHLFVSVAHFNRQEKKDLLPKTVVNKTNNSLPSQRVEQVGSSQNKKSYASTLHGDANSNVEKHKIKRKHITLSDEELVQVTDPQDVALVKVKHVKTMNNLYRLCREEGFVDLKIPHICKMWLWLQFQNVESCNTFKKNNTLASYFSLIKPSINLDDTPSQENKTNSKVDLVFDNDKDAVSVSESDDENEIQEALHVSHEANEVGKDQEACIHSNEVNIACEEVMSETQMDRADNSSSSNLSQPPGHFALFRDLNEVRDKNEHYGTEFHRHLANNFNALITDAGLIELPLGGHNFTWMNKAGSKMSKLDRFLVSQHVTNIFPDIKVRALPRGWSNHSPILLHCDKTDYGLLPFKFFHSWLQHEGFDDCLQKAYKEYSITNPQMPFHEKLKRLKKTIKEWNHQGKSTDMSRKLKIVRKLEDIKEKIDSNSAFDSEKEDTMKLLKERDENTQFFHDILKQKRSQQAVQGIMMDGNWVTNPHQVKTVFCNFYKEKFDKCDSLCDLSTVTPQHTLDQDDNLELEKNIFDDEILLSKVIDKVVSQEPSAFIPGRFILDGPLMLSEIMSWASHCAKNAVSLGLIQGASIGESGYKISHLFYEDDVVIISDWNRQDMINIIHVLNVFYLDSGLKINVSKSNAYGLGVNPQDIEDMARDTRCSSGSLGIYYLSIFKCPDSVVNSLKAMRASFFSGAFNLALLQKWRWRLVNNPDFIWARAIVAIHGVEARADGSGVWASIISTYFMLHNRNLLPMNTLCRKVGNGLSIHFWKDAWNGDDTLMSRQIEGSRNEAALGSLVSDLDQVELLDGFDSWRWSLDDDVDHVFFGCDLSCDVWCLVRRWTNLDMPSFSSWFDCLQWFEDWRASRDVKDKAYVIFVTLLWCL